jgi:hypothetical protein
MKKTGRLEQEDEKWRRHAENKCVTGGGVEGWRPDAEMEVVGWEMASNAGNKAGPEVDVRRNKMKKAEAKARRKGELLDRREKRGWERLVEGIYEWWERSDRDSRLEQACEQKRDLFFITYPHFQSAAIIVAFFLTSGTQIEKMWPHSFLRQGRLIWGRVHG